MYFAQPTCDSMSLISSCIGVNEEEFYIYSLDFRKELRQVLRKTTIFILIAEMFEIWGAIVIYTVHKMNGFH